MKIQLRHELLLGGMAAAAAGLSAWAWGQAPELVPVHWNLQGEVDRYGSKAEGLLLVPVMLVFLQGLLLAVPRLDPSKRDYSSFAGAYATIRFATAALLLLVHGGLVAATLGVPVDMGRAVTVGVGLLFAVLGNVMGKLRPNWFAGFRTPWTLASKRSWTRTHRLAGLVWLFGGLLTAALGVAWPPAGIIALLIVSLPGTLGLTAYSWWVWKHDPSPVSALET